MKQQEKKFPTRVFNASLISSEKISEIVYAKNPNPEAPEHYWRPPEWLQQILRTNFENGRNAGREELQEKLKDLLNIIEGD